MVFTRDMENLILYLAIIGISFFCIDVSDWVFSIEYSVALTIAALMLLIRNWISDNKSFTFQATCYFTHLLQAALLSGCAYFLLIGIYYSVTYIFNIFPQSEYNVSSYLSMICFIIGMPCLFLTFNNRQETLSTQEKNLLWKYLQIIYYLLRYSYTRSYYTYILRLFSFRGAYLKAELHIWYSLLR